MATTTTNISVDRAQLESLRDAAAFVSKAASDLLGRDVTITVTSIVEDGACHELDRLEKIHNNGQPFGEIGEKKKVIPRRRTKEPKKDLVIRIDETLLKNLRKAAYHLEKTVAEIVLTGAEKEVTALEKKWNKGKRFPKREDGS